MRRVLPLLLILMLAALACSLTNDDRQQATSIPVITLSPAVAPTIAQTITPTSELRATPTQFTGSTTGGTTGGTTCTARTDWPIYTVAAGDTLGIIAERTGSTLAQLVQANCLSNPDSIFVGQQLRVPRTPSSATATTGSGTIGSTTSGTTGGTTSGSTTSGSTTSGTTGGTTGGTTNPQLPRFVQELRAQPTTSLGSNGWVTLQPTIGLDAGVVDNADRVRYYAGVSSTDAAPVNIATDIDPYDGTAVQYTFSEFDDELYFWALAENEFGITRSNTLRIVYDPNYGAGGTGGRIVVSPFLGFDGALYTLQYNSNVTLRWEGGPTTAQRVDFYYTPGGTGTTPLLIGTDFAPSDGITTTWLVPEWTLGHLYATATMPNGAQQTSSVVNVYSEGSTPQE